MVPIYKILAIQLLFWYILYNMTMQTLKLNELDFKDHTPPKNESSVYGIYIIQSSRKFVSHFSLFPFSYDYMLYSYYINVTYIFTFHIDK